jgi:hypothetical protein
MDASKLNEAVGDRYGPALERVLVPELLLGLVFRLVLGLVRVIVPGVGLRMASVVGCMHFSN